MKAKILLLLLIPLFTEAQIITTIAGNGIIGYSGDGGVATDAQITPYGVAVDNFGNLYIADFSNHCVRKINSSGIISTIAGNGLGGYSGDGGPSTASKLNGPCKVATDNFGNVYIADSYNKRIRKINTLGIITTVAGNGTAGFSGDGGPATAAELSVASAVTVDVSGNVYIADTYNARIRKVDASGIITTIAGNGVEGVSGDGGAATAAEIISSFGIKVDNSGNVYFTTASNGGIRVINGSGVINKVAGGINLGFCCDGGAATNAELYYPNGITVDNLGNIYIADQDNNRVRMINASGIITTIAGNGYGAPFSGGYSGDGGPATAAELWTVDDVAVDSCLNLYIADAHNGRVRKVAFGPSCWSTNIEGALIQHSYIIYPNPVNELLTISSTENILSIAISNILGQTVYSHECNTTEAQVNIAALSTGIYFARINGNEIRRFVKQ